MKGSWVVGAPGLCGLLAVVGCAPSGDDDAGAEAPREVTRVPLRRLTGSEYDRSVRDLIGIDLGFGARIFPADPASHGFDRVAEGLSVSPLLVELYEQAAAEVAATILERPVLEPVDLALDPTEVEVDIDAAYHAVRETEVGLFSGGSLTTRVTLPLDGTYRISAEVWGDQVPPDPVVLGVGVVTEPLVMWDVTAASAAEAEWIDAEIELRAGVHTLSVQFANDYYDSDLGLDRNAFIGALRVEGPLDFDPPPTPAWDRVMVCDPDVASDARGCIRRVLEGFATKAWRRPLVAGELDDLTALVDPVLEAGDPPTWGLEFALRAVMASPNFVFLVDPVATAPMDAPEPVDAFALAARLSYLIWSSMPDEELFALAADGTLVQPEVLREQVRRMMADDRASALADDFAGQWLFIRALDNAAPDFWSYPSFTEDLRDAMHTSMRLGFLDMVAGDAPLTDLAHGTTAWLDEPLARHYGLPPQGLEDFARFDVEPWGRYGWMSTAGWLTATSYPTRTSPVRRGVSILTNLLCDEPEPPPPGVEGFPEPDDDVQTVRDRLELHRQDPACAGCHDDIDPVGLAVEHFDGVGAWRDLDMGVEVDASGELPDGTTFYGVQGLAEVLSKDPRLTRCMVDRAFTYAHGRAPVEADEPFLDDVHDAFLDDGATLEALLAAVVTAGPFRHKESAP